MDNTESKKNHIVHILCCGELGRRFMDAFGNHPFPNVFCVYVDELRRDAGFRYALSPDEVVILIAEYSHGLCDVIVSSEQLMVSFAQMALRFWVVHPNDRTLLGRERECMQLEHGMTGRVALAMPGGERQAALGMVCGTIHDMIGSIYSNGYINFDSEDFVVPQRRHPNAYGTVFSASGPKGTALEDLAKDIQGQVGLFEEAEEAGGHKGLGDVFWAQWYIVTTDNDSVALRSLEKSSERILLILPENVWFNWSHSATVGGMNRTTLVIYRDIE